MKDNNTIVLIVILSVVFVTIFLILGFHFLRPVIFSGSGSGDSGSSGSEGAKDK